MNRPLPLETFFMTVRSITTRSKRFFGCLVAMAWVMGASTADAQKDSPIRILFDTDITGDVDDVLALAMLHALADRGECTIEAVTISKVNPLAAPFVDAVNTFYGRPSIPIGVTKDAQRRDSKYLSLVHKQADGRKVYPYNLPPGDILSAVDLLRRSLAQADDGSMTIVQVGLASNLAALLDSKPDQHSPLPGAELVRRKVRLVSVMAGAFRPIAGKPRFLEANVRNGIRSMQRFASKWPGEIPIVWSDFQIGISAKYPRQSIANDFGYLPHHIVRDAYLKHSGPDHDRPTWDLTSVLYAVRPEDHYFGLSEPGRVSVEDDGYTTFRQSKNGRDRYLTMSPQQALRVVEVQRTLVSQPPTRHRNPGQTGIE